MHENLLNKKRAPLLMALCFALYCGQYLGRYCLSACISSMVASDVFTKTELGTVATCFFLAYACMQIPSGLLNDKAKASLMAGLGLGGSAVINLLFPFLGNLDLMRVLWFLNGICQALVWPALMHILSDVNFHTSAGEKPALSIVTLTYSVPTGVCLSYGLCALLLHFYNYKACFLVSGTAMAIIAVLWFLLALPLLKKDESRKSDSAGEPAAAGNAISRRGSGTLKELLAASLPLLLLGVLIHGLLKDGLTTWIPTYLTEVLQMSPENALLLTLLLPIANFPGVWIADTLNRKWLKNEMSTNAFCFGLTLLCLLFMILLFRGSIVGTIVCFAGVSCLMTAVNTIATSITPLHFARLSIVSTITGVLDGAVYLGSAFSTSLFAILSEQYGWTGTRILWCACAVLGMIVSLLCVRKWGKFRSERY